MTIKSDATNKQLRDKSLDYDYTFISWWKHSQDKSIAFVSLGAFWDFRNEKSDKKNEKYIGTILDYFTDNMDGVAICSTGHYLEHVDIKEKFWIANRYYASRMEIPGNRSNLNLTVRQISKLAKMVKFLEKED